MWSSSQVLHYGALMGYGRTAKASIPVACDPAPFIAHAVQIRTRFELLPVRLGRSYANDFIVEDAGAAPEHMTISSDPDGGLLASAVGEATFEILDDPQARQLARIDGNTVIRIGKILLRVRSEADVL